MRLFLNVFLLVVALGLTVGAGLLHGRYSQRWGGDSALEQAALRLTDLPDSFGDWQLVEELTLPQAVSDELQCAGYLSHRYRHTATGQVVTVAVLLGPPGPISVHTPEICYSSREFEVAGERQKKTVEGIEDGQEFWSLKLNPRRLEGTPLDVCYAWTVDGRWQASENPRIAFAGQPLLFKIQLAAADVPTSGTERREPCLEFLQEFLSPLNRQLFGSHPAAGP